MFCINIGTYLAVQRCSTPIDKVASQNMNETQETQTKSCSSENLFYSPHFRRQYSELILSKTFSSKTKIKLHSVIDSRFRIEKNCSTDLIRVWVSYHNPLDGNKRQVIFIEYMAVYKKTITENVCTQAEHFMYYWDEDLMSDK